MELKKSKEMCKKKMEFRERKEKVRGKMSSGLNHQKKKKDAWRENISYRVTIQNPRGKMDRTITE